MEKYSPSNSYAVYSRFKILPYIIPVLFGVMCCSPKPFIPVNEGREYGNPKTPLFVMHARELNQWTLNRVEHHHILKRLICFNYACRKMIGRSKTLLIISKKEYIKVIKKNAERGFFKTTPTTPKTNPVKPDSIVIPMDTVTVVQSKVGAPFTVAPLKADSLITLGEFLFETNSYKLKSEHYPELNSLADYLKLRPNLEVSITGHTDNVGEERHNVTLSTRRAEVVAEYLAGKGVDYNKVVFKGLGSSSPIASNQTEDGRSKNRRVEILIRNAKK